MPNYRKVIGYRKNGSPIYLIAGGSGEGVTLTHSQAVNRLQEIKTELERLGELDDLSPEDETYFDTLTDEFGSVDKHRKSLERQAKLAHVSQAAQGFQGLRLERGQSLAPRVTSSRDEYDSDPFMNPDSVEDCRFRNPWDLSEMRSFGRSREEISQELRARAFSAIEKMKGTNDNVRKAATQIIEDFDDNNSSIARLALATSSPEYMRGFVKAAKGAQHLMTNEEKNAVERAMTLTNTAGGYLVPFQLDPTVIVTANGSRNQIREAARKVVATGNIWNGVSAGAVVWSWDAEAAEVSDDSPTFAQPSIPVYKAAGFVPISIEALEDEANVAQEVGRLLSFGRDVLESAAFTTGSGSGQPTGLITALTGTSSEVTASTADTFAIADIYKLDNALPARYRANSAWLANRAIYNRVRQFDTTGGAGLWEYLGNGQPGQLLGRPALEAEDMSGAITALANNYSLIYGDFSNYVIADRIGMTVEFVPQLFGTTNGRPKGQRGWYAYYRVGADSVNDAAFRMLVV